MDLMIEEKRISADELQKKIYEKKVGILVKLCCCCRTIRRKMFITLKEQKVEESHYSVMTGVAFVAGQALHTFDLFTDCSLANELYWIS